MVMDTRLMAMGITVRGRVMPILALFIMPRAITTRAGSIMDRVSIPGPSITAPVIMAAIGGIMDHAIMARGSHTAGTIEASAGGNTNRVLGDERKLTPVEKRPEHEAPALQR
jgi:hypothetical protein